MLWNFYFFYFCFQTRFEIPLESESFVLKSINKKWKSWKSHLKTSNFDPHASIEGQMVKIPERVNADQYTIIHGHWSTDKTIVCTLHLLSYYFSFIIYILVHHYFVLQFSRK